MKLSKNWLQEYIELPESGAEIADLITMHIAEVEEVHDQVEMYRHIVVGKITEVTAHPNADKLRITLVDVGTALDSKAEPVQIVCGGSNLEVDQYVVVALPGSKVTWHGEGDLVEITKSKIRGEVSFGMICGASEVGLADAFPANGEREIVDLTELAKANSISTGTEISQALGMTDVIIEIDNKTLTHRPDLFSQIGFARELSVVLGRQLTLPELATPQPTSTSPLTIKIDTEACRRYIGGVFTVTPGVDSPVWMKQRLAAVGVASRGAVVDITNYVMMEYGQPLHAFDSAAVSEHTIVVRSAKVGEAMNTLDGKTIELTEQNAVIANSTTPLALAGIMGGIGSEISDTTTEIILESANFDPVSIRKTAQQFGKRTDGSTRHEKKLQLVYPEYGFNRAAQLLKELCGASLTSPIVDMGEQPVAAQAIQVSAAYIARVIGTTIDQNRITAILTGLGCSVESVDDTFVVTPPDFRSDLRNQEDIIEEIARMFGYGNIPLQPLKGMLATPTREASWQWGNTLINHWAGRGYVEVMQYSYYGRTALDNLGLSEESHLQILNPMNPNQVYLRTTLVHGLLESLARNLQLQQEQSKLVEYGHIYQAVTNPHTGLPIELPVITAVISGEDAQAVYQSAKGEVQALLAHHGISASFTIDADHKPYAMPGTHASWVGKDNAQPVAQLYLLTEGATANYIPANIGKRYVAVVVIPVEQFGQLAGASKVEFEPYSTLPAVELDISILVKRSIAWAKIERCIRERAGKNLQTVSVFDAYTGKGVAEDAIAYGIRMKFQSHTETLEMSTLEVVRTAVVDALKQEFQAEQRV